MKPLNLRGDESIEEILEVVDNTAEFRRWEYSASGIRDAYKEANISFNFRPFYLIQGFTKCVAATLANKKVSALVVGSDDDMQLLPGLVDREDIKYLPDPDSSLKDIIKDIEKGLAGGGACSIFKIEYETIKDKIGKLIKKSQVSKLALKRYSGYKSKK